MRASRIMRVIAATVGVLLLAGCTAGVTEESLDAAEVEGDAPVALTVEPGYSDGHTFADMFGVKIAWDTVAGLKGYQLQSKSEDDEDWSTISLDEDRMLFVFGDTTEAIIGYDKTVKYRVRGVSQDGTRVTPWSEEASYVTDHGNVLYEVEGTARTASITLRTNTGSEQAKISVPLKSKMGTTGLWLQAHEMTPYISAQATDYGSITCRITSFGQVISENTSSGYGSIATCSAR